MIDRLIDSQQVPLHALTTETDVSRLFTVQQHSCLKLYYLNYTILIAVSLVTLQGRAK